jgi:hypothetical protein
MAIPGRRSLAFASGWFDAPTVSRVFEPLIADWQREWTDAPQSRRPWISIRGTIALTMTVVALTPRAILMTPAPPVLIRRTLMRITIFTAAASLAMLAPWLYELRGMPLGRLAIGALFLLPSIVALIFPFAMPWVADGLRQQSTPTPAERMAAVRVGLTAMTFALGIIGFAMPIANQQYRELVAPDAVKRPVPRGVRELTLTELIASPPPPHFGGHTPHVAAAELNKRLSITLLPAVPSSVVVAAARGRRNSARLRDLLLLGILERWVVGHACRVGGIWRGARRAVKNAVGCACVGWLACLLSPHGGAVHNVPHWCSSPCSPIGSASWMPPVMRDVRSMRSRSRRASSLTLAPSSNAR